MLYRALAAVSFVLAASAGAQRVPGRDLLTFPLGLAGEAAAFGTGPAGGFWNPATAVLGPGEKGRIAGAALSAPIDLALTGQVFTGSARPRTLARIGTFSLGIAHAAITDLVHTETDPQSVGNDIPYSTWVVSLGASRKVSEHVTAGAAARWHTGHVGTARHSEIATDAGVVFDRLTRRDVRIAASSFLLTLDAKDSPALALAADARIAGTDSARVLRGGIGYVRARGAAVETYPFLDGRVGKLGIRGGPVRVDAYGSVTWRMRLAILIHHAGYTLGVVREDNESGIAPTYQLGVTSVFR